MAEYSIDSIESINGNEIIFYNEKNIVCKIDLLKCHKNWNKECKSRKISLFSIIFKDKSPKCVGKRELLIENPYYQFWDLEKTKFIYFGNAPKDERYSICRAIENKLISSGWHTIDYC